MQCVVCLSESVELFENFSKLKRVTSDAKVWPAGGKLAVCCECGVIQKIVDKAWLEEIEIIYQDYEVYHQSNGEEQAVFNAQGQPEKRSNVLVQYIYSKGLLSNNHGKILDYGCGNGEFIGSLSKVHPECHLFGLDLSTKYKKRLDAIPGFKELYQPSNFGVEKFDLITLIHTLEHLINPIDVLSSIRGCLREGGGLFIQVPNVEKNPFDILIADHLLHLTPLTLTSILIRAGFTIVYLETDVVSKEISLFAVPNMDVENNQLPLGNIDLENIKATVNNNLNFIQQLLCETEILKSKGDFAIFGTSIASTWLYNYFPEVAFFIDEDPNRIGRLLYGKQVWAPADVYGKNVPISIPLSPAIADVVIARHFRRENQYIFPQNLRNSVVNLV